MTPEVDRSSEAHASAQAGRAAGVASPPAIEIMDVSKRFRLYHERPSSLKERVVSLRGARYEEFWALSNVSLTVNQGETIGLIGPNGSGKSTLLKCIAGILHPDRGEVRTHGRIASLLELGAGFHPELSGRENVYLNASILGLTRKETDRYFDAIVSFAGLEQFIDMQVKHFSSGMYVRLGFAVAVHVDPEILLVDEVLAVGDESFQRKCLDRIRAFQMEGRTIVFVTHAVDLVARVCDRAVMLAEGRITEDGAPRSVIRTFRELMHPDEASEETDEEGTMDAVVEDAQILDASGAPRDRFQPGDPMKVRIDVVPKRPLEDVVVGIAVQDERDELIYGTNTINYDLLDSLDRPVQVMFEVPSLPMLDGRFDVTIGVHTRDDRIRYHWLTKKLHFEVRSSGTEQGMVHLGARCTVTESDTTATSGA